MKLFFRTSLLFLVLVWSFYFSFGQTRIIHKGTYTAVYSDALKDPLYVAYYLYKGGGDCNRAGMGFSQCDDNQTANNEDYTNSGFQRGHLANCADFAGNCVDMKSTFCFFNCVPQTPQCNNGQWKSAEYQIRVLSQNHRLYIIAGALFNGARLKPGSKIGVPSYVYKIAWDTDSGQRVFYGLYKNDSRGEKEMISYDDLIYKIQQYYHIKSAQELRQN